MLPCLSVCLSLSLSVSVCACVCVSVKVAVQACDHEITRYFKAYLIQNRSTDGSKLYTK